MNSTARATSHFRTRVMHWTLLPFSVPDVCIVQAPGKLCTDEGERESEMTRTSWSFLLPTARGPCPQNLSPERFRRRNGMNLRFASHCPMPMVSALLLAPLQPRLHSAIVAVFPEPLCPDRDTPCLEQNTNQAACFMQAHDCGRGLSPSYGVENLLCPGGLVFEKLTCWGGSILWISSDVHPIFATGASALVFCRSDEEIKLSIPCRRSPWSD